jgi:hypothetical protein
MPFDFSLVTAPFRMQPGLRRAARAASPLTPARAGGRHQHEKMAVLASFAPQALVATPGFDVRPVLAAIAVEAAKSDAPAFVQDGEVFLAPRLGWKIAGEDVQGTGDAAIGALLESLPPARRATALLCLAFEEDFALIDGDDATIPWLAVCLPSRWAPEDKVGRHFAEVHAPVADNALLVSASEQLARLVTGAERWERDVWTISADPRLHQHPARPGRAWPTGADAEAIGALAVFRHEYQSFIPLRGCRQAVFTIHVESTPLARAFARRADALRVHAALASMTPAVLAYRGLDLVRDRLLDWLAGHAATLPPAALP